jgi:Cu2+-exporting ATPase
VDETAGESLENEAARGGAPAASEREIESGLCKHCELPVPSSARNPEFCCPGCETVYGILHGEELCRFYELGGAEGRPIGAEPKPGSFDWLEELEAQASGSTVRLTLDVQGIHCAACVWVLQEIWRRRDGAIAMELNPSIGRVVLSYDRDKLSLIEYLQQVEALGYRMAPASEGRKHTGRGLLIRLGICASLSMNAMMFAAAFYLGLGDDEQNIDVLFRWIAFGLATLAVIIGGPVFFKAAWAGLKQRVLHLDLPIALGIALAYSGSVWWFFARESHSYFDTVTIFVTLMLAGRFLQERAIARNRDMLLANDGTEHLRVRRFHGDELERVRIEKLEPGDALWLAPGELVPARSLLIAQARPFSLEWISGESAPQMLQPGDEVPAGAFLAGHEPVRVDVFEKAEDSGLLELLRGDDSGEKHVALSGFWAKLNRIYVQLVLIAALFGAGLWLWIDPSQVLDVVVSILIVTCPCALGIAIPLSFDLALAQLRKRGIFVRDPGLLDKARRWERVFFDKTGTLTWGGLRARTHDALEERERVVLATMLQSSAHPVSEAITQALSAEQLPFDRRIAVAEEVGSGLEAHADGHVWRLGRARWALEGGAGGAAAPVPETLVPETVFARDGEVLARYVVEEDFRPGFEQEFVQLREEGIEVHLLSGDRQAKVDAAAQRLGLSAEFVHGEMQPEDKARYVQEHDAASGLMIGDGLNDAPAFRVAGSTGTPALDRPVLPSQSDFFYVGAGAEAVRHVRVISVLLHRVVQSNLLLAGLYNALVLALCFAALMTPLLCALLMPASSLALISQSVTRMQSGVRRLRTVA